MCKKAGFLRMFFFKRMVLCTLNNLKGRYTINDRLFCPNIGSIHRKMETTQCMTPMDGSKWGLKASLVKVCTT